MSLFTFDEQFPLFDATPVENLFLQEYLPSAKGDYVKVYLYGLMHSYHPQPGITVESIAHELSQTKEEVLAAFRYWERKGLVQRVGDNPPAFRYINAKQLMFMRQSPAQDSHYAQFADALYAAFGEDRQLHGQETALAYEWVEDLGLPPEVVLMLVNHCISTRGKHFSFKSAQRLAVELARDKVSTIEDAELVLGRSKAVEDGTRRVLRRLGKRRQPSEDEMALYRKWTETMGFSLEAVEAACAETTKGDPTMAYLDGILRGLQKRTGKAMKSAAQVENYLTDEKNAVAPVKEVLGVLGLRMGSPDSGMTSCYRQMADIADHQVIMAAAREAARSGGKLSDVMSLVTTWHEKGLDTPEKVNAYIEAFHEANRQLTALYETAGISGKPTAANRQLLEKWRGTWGFSMEMLHLAATYAQGAGSKMPYMDVILKAWHDQKITSPEAASANRKTWEDSLGKGGKSKGKTVGEQQYTQRSYEGDDPIRRAAEAMMKEGKGEHE